MPQTITPPKFSLPKIVYNTVAMVGWSANYPYLAGAEIIDPAYHVQKATTPGTSGSTPPTFNDSGGSISEPLPPPSAAVLSYTAGGSLAAETCYVKVTYVNGSGETTPSPEANIAVPANNFLIVQSPPAESPATGWNVYASTTSGAEVLQNSTPIPIGTNWTQSAALATTGAAPPSSNTAAGLTWTDQGSAATQTLYFQYPPTHVPAYTYEATRHDNVASSGVRESLLERIDSFLEFQMEWIINGADLSAWNSFMEYALSGGAFDFYPDQTLSSFTRMLLEDAKWSAAYKSPGFFSFSARFRTEVPWP